MKDEVKDLVGLSKYAGERFDLVQAGGGNTSVKLADGRMLIKASGYALSEVDSMSGYSSVRTKEVADILINREVLNKKIKREREHITSVLMSGAIINQNIRPSIETLLHSLLLKYTLHTHPVAVNIIVSRDGWKNTLKSIFNKVDIALIDYYTPGIDLAIKLKEQIDFMNSVPKIIFLQNHGLIVTSDNLEEVKTLTEYVLDSIEPLLNVDLSKYKLTNRISNILNNIHTGDYITYLSTDLWINKICTNKPEVFMEKPCCPDTFVFCGMNAVKINAYESENNLRKYFQRHRVLPKVILYQGYVFLVADNVRKAREIEDVLKSHLLILLSDEGSINFLPKEELDYLGNWEAEKFRQNI